MRFYGFGNYYLSSLQQGLQAAHCVADMFMKYQYSEDDVPSRKEFLLEWAGLHKTMVLLNGGNSSELHDLYGFLNDYDNPYPYIKFHEDEQSLNCALTYVSIVLPEKIYKTAALVRNVPEAITSVNSLTTFLSNQKFSDIISNDIEDTFEISEWEHELIKRLNTYSLAK